MIARLLASVALLLMVAVLGGCSGTPGPPPTTSAPAFASDEEAFAAAEATYRAYVDALNQVDLSDPATFEPVYALTTGEANAELRKSLSEMHADGWSVHGTSRVARVEPVEAAGRATIDLAVCPDVSQVIVVGADGDSVVDADRVDVQSMSVSIDMAPTSSTGMLVSLIEGREGPPSCGP